MKSALLFFAGLFAYTYIHSQEFTNYGFPTSKELNLKSCAFDTEATAVVLLHEAISIYNDNYNLITDHHIRIKVLKEKGIDASNISIPFYRDNDFEYVHIVDGVVINQNEKGELVKTPLDRKSIYYKNITKYKGEVSFAFPAVKVGSIIEYKYRSTMKNYGGLRDWYFQREYPVISSEYMLHILPNYEFAYRVFKKDEWNVSIDQQPTMGRVIFKMQNIPGLEPEPYMDSYKENLQRVAFQLSGSNIVDYNGSVSKTRHMTNWTEVIKELVLNESFGFQLDKDLSGTKDFVNATKSVQPETERLRMVYDYVRKNMKWDGYQGIYSDKVKAVWNKKTGTQGEINMILVNLLRQAGLDANPALVCEREYGKVHPETPFIEQFNSVFACVNLNGRKYFLDASDQHSPFHITPYSILNTTALIVNRKTGGLVTVADETNKHKETVSLFTSVNPDQTITGNAAVYSFDYAKVLKVPKYRSDYEKYIKVYFGDRLANGKIDSMDIKDADNDSLPLQHAFKFSAALNQTGEYVTVPLNVFTSLQSNPFISAKRLSNINFGFRQELNLNIYINLPENYSIDEIPKSIQLINGDKTMLFSRQLFRDPKDKQIVARIKVDFAKSLYAAEEYDDIKQFYKKMFELLDEQIVLRKK